MIRSPTCIKGNDLTLSYLVSMNVVVNMGKDWGIPTNDEAVPFKQPEE